MAAAIKGMMAARDRLYYTYNLGDGPDELDIDAVKVRLCSDLQLCPRWASGRYRHNNPERTKTVTYLQSLFRELKAEAVWVRGHAGHEWNTRADALAYRGRTGEFKLKRDRKRASSGS